MALNKDIMRETLDAAEDLSNSLFYIVKIDANGQAALCGNGETAYGVVYEGANVGGSVTVAVEGRVKVIASAAVTAGTLCASNAGGKAATATTGENVFGIFKTSAGAADEIVEVHIARGINAA